jgi:putative transposase
MAIASGRGPQHGWPDLLRSVPDWVGGSIDADVTVATLDAIVTARGSPAPPRLVSRQRRRHRLHRAGIALAEPLGRVLRLRMRDELLAIERFDTLLKAQVLAADWRREYNEYRPHSAVGMLTPVEFARQWRTNQPQLT